MSRAFRVRLAETMARTVAVAGGLEGQLELLPLLGLARMSELLGGELAARGFVVEGGVARRAVGDVGIEVGLGSGRVFLRLAGEEEVAVAGEAVVATPLASRAAAEEEARAGLRAELAAGLEARAEEARREAAARLERVAEAARGELDEAVARVTAAALRERAAQLGEIESISEDPATGELVIKVKV